MYAPDNRRKDARDVIYRSNSSLDLIYAEHPSGNGLRREYGSHGSIDVIGGANDRLPAMVHSYSGVSAPEKTPGLNRTVDRIADGLTTDHADGPPSRSSASPKPRLKLNKLWGGAAPVLNRAPLDDSGLSAVADVNKRKQFAHYDCQSLMANLTYAAEIRGALLSRRRNTTTGASAASLLATRGLPPGEDAVPDTGDGRSNELLESCPFFRNELGGEEERCVSLCWKTARGAILGQSGGWHRPRAAYGISMLEFPPGQTHWRHGCPFARSLSPFPIESQDLGALYYRNYFYNQPHQNWFGMDENLGPVAISIKKERVELRRGGGDVSAPASQLAWQLGINNGGAEEQLLRLDEQCVTRHYKVGVMYCKSGQSTEEEMYNNQEAGPAFVEFLKMLGQTVRLKDFDKYKAGLDNRTDSTGLYSVFTTYQGCDIMFHVSTMLPYTPNNRQQLLRKRHIGNDIVTIVFQEPGAAPFTPRNIRSQFQHVFVVVRAIDPCTENTHYSIAVSRAKEVPLFGPPIKDGAIYPKGEAFTDLLLSKVINGENAAIQSPKFSTMATRTRQEYLKDLAKNYVTASTVETGQKFCAGGSLLDCIMGVSADTVVFVEDSTRQIVLVLPTSSLLGGSCRSGRRSPQTSPLPEAVRRRSHDDAASPRHNRHKRASANTSSLTEDLIRMMDAELGEGGRGSAVSGTGGSGPGGAAPLPLPDAGALDWAALVHTATRAMLQICEEHQYPSMDNTDPSLENLPNEPTTDSWNDVSAFHNILVSTATTFIKIPPLIETVYGTDDGASSCGGVG
ncbi:hypothetical protein HF086_005962 [Spodoptera exigua]|uniref:Rap-GAP domain-containing protein n=1 Tax=Spodoptera exigua TaxID=7107 RepID=A0A922M7B0_SPOEX|nr:hypothetical protein HF086_005962 [Spodoptera exigua]